MWPRTLADSSVQTLLTRQQLQWQRAWRSMQVGCNVHSSSIARWSTLHDMVAGHLYHQCEDCTGVVWTEGVILEVQHAIVVGVHQGKIGSAGRCPIPAYQSISLQRT